MSADDRHGWTHSICATCWNKSNPNRQAVVVVPEFAAQETCCFCGQPTSGGIYMRCSVNEAPHCKDHEGP